VNHYLQTTYADDGRGPHAFNCWGLTRSARHTLFGKPLLPSYDDIDPDDKPALTDACKAVRGTGFHEVSPRPGAIATGWRGQCCVHIGLVVQSDGRLWVLETRRKVGPTLTGIPKFERRFTKVVYYDD